MTNENLKLRKEIIVLKLEVASLKARLALTEAYRRLHI